MTIGPDPMTRTDSISVRRGLTRASPSPSAVIHGRSRAPRHQVAERVEQPRRVVRSGRGLRVVLHAERRYVATTQTFDDVVVQVDVADLRATVGSIERLRPRRVDG